MADIDFFTFIAKNSLPFAKFLRQTGERTKNGKHNIHWKCVLSQRAKKIPDGFECVTENKNTSTNPSMRHAHAIHDAIRNATSDYIIISDADIAIIYKNWDEEIIQILDEGHSCFGTPNSTNEYGETDFPNVPFFAFKKEIIQKVNLDFKPILDKKNIIVRVKAEKKKIMGRGVGKLVFFETGCKLSSEFKKAGLESKCLCLKPVRQESNETKIPLNFEQRVKYINKKKNNKRICHNHLIEYHYNEKLFLTHMGGAGNGNLILQHEWETKIENYLKSVLCL